MENWRVQCALFFPILAIVFGQDIPSDRTMKVCTGSSLRLDFDGASYNEKVLLNWLFTPVGGKRKDIGLKTTESAFRPVGDYVGRGVERVGVIGIIIPHVTAADSGLYESQDPNFIYNITVQDPCLNISHVVSRDDKKCVDIHCATGYDFNRIEVTEGGDLQQFDTDSITFCSTSVIAVACVADNQGQEMSDTTTVVLTIKSDDDYNEKESDDDYNEKESGGLRGEIIAVIVISSFVAIVAIIATTVFFVKRQRGNGRGCMP
ncbi:uncharacterized protein LOC132543320 isoform X2 [Ylistrum balloti]|uniref:uncharacterized protein LOC132543320 isoform X2 n=1 Tax=Ylistrum balloti TaxID=509963 RepID=UPI002905A78A|nr:uncharacterized protein LOC132543320 isoform X2 [Ylistrum balloti]